MEEIWKKYSFSRLSLFILLSTSGCKLKQVVGKGKRKLPKWQNRLKEAENDNETTRQVLLIGAAIKTPINGSKKYVMHDTKSTHYVARLLGLVEFKGKKLRRSRHGVFLS